MGRYSEAKIISERLDEYYRNGLSIQHMGYNRSMVTDLLLLLADAKISMNDWSGAMQAYKNLIDKDISATQQRKSSMGLCRCLFELGGYYHAIDSGKYALDVDRHYPGVHKQGRII
mmetsp:Transcript_31143/g.45547  ORF Transcript_31143/g.45547 Transcript_31143/m.45547 type:complete len:116 (-) Transcript_31143:12-359(-)